MFGYAAKLGHGSEAWTLHVKSLLDEYYSLRGWDKNGIPTQDTLTRLGLS